MNDYVYHLLGQMPHHWLPGHPGTNELLLRQAKGLVAQLHQYFGWDLNRKLAKFYAAQAGLLLADVSVEINMPEDADMMVTTNVAPEDKEADLAAQIQRHYRGYPSDLGSVLDPTFPPDGHSMQVCLRDLLNEMAQ